MKIPIMERKRTKGELLYVPHRHGSCDLEADLRRKTRTTTSSIHPSFFRPPQNLVFHWQQAGTPIRCILSIAFLLIALALSKVRNTKGPWQLIRFPSALPVARVCTRESARCRCKGQASQHLATIRPLTWEVARNSGSDMNTRACTSAINIADFFERE